MSKGRGVDDVLAKLAALRGQGPTPEARALLAKSLSSKVSFVVAKAADLAREFKFADLCPELIQAFDRFLKDRDSSDKGCAAKIAIVRAALELECPAESIFRAGIRHVQMEGSFGPPVDVAAELRGLCGLGLVQVRARDLMNELVDLLADSEPQARIGAIRALAGTGREEGVALLRFKAVSGDRDPVVVGECLTALLKLQPRETLTFIERFLDSSQEAVREEAVLALGTSREPKALELLKQQYAPGIDPQFRQTLLTAVAGLRFPEAIDWLASLVETERVSAAVDALRALRIYRHDAALRERLTAIVEKRADDSIRSVFTKEFSNG